MRSQHGVVWPYVLLSVALLGALSFGWYQTRQKNQLAQEAENKYMSAFHRLKWTSEQLEERTAKLLATNDPLIQESLLADLRVFSAQAVEHMSFLPLAYADVPRIAHFLNTLRETSDEFHYKLTYGGELSQEDWNRLMELRRQAVFFEDELSHLLGLVGAGQIRWRDTVRVTGAGQDGTATTPITKSFSQLEEVLAAPPGEENVLEPGADPMAHPKVSLGPPVDQVAAARAIAEFVPSPLKGEPRLTGQSDPEGETGGLALYFFEAEKQNGTVYSFGVSVHGGHVIYMIDGRPVTEKLLTEAQLVQQARDLLAGWGYPEMAFVSAAENDRTLVMDFAPVEQGVAVHPDMVKVMLAMDNGELLGFDARNYWINRHQRNLGQPSLNAQEARQHVAPRVRVQGEPRLVVVADRRGHERLAWEFRGNVEEQAYRIFIDAKDGTEINVLRVAGDPAPPLNE